VIGQENPHALFSHMHRQGHLVYPEALQCAVSLSQIANTHAPNADF